MARRHSFIYTFLALLLLAIVAAVCLALGNWQLQRAAQREAINASIQSGQRLSPLELQANTLPSTLHNWQPATASGQWLPDLTVLLTNRNYNGLPGYWVVTPLLLDNSDNTAILVLRGWLPRPAPNSPIHQPAVPKEPGTVHIQGLLLDHVPRLFELWSRSGTNPSALPSDYAQASAKPLPEVQNLHISDVAQASGLKLLPAVLEQSTASRAPKNNSLVRDWPRPSVDASTNRGYAFQWFGFSAIAIFAFLTITWRAWRRYASASSQ